MVEERELRELARRTAGATVTSLYLDVDGRHRPRPTHYEAAVAHLFRVARASAQRQGDGSVDAVDADLARVAAWLKEGLDRATTRGVAIFSCASRDVFEVFALPFDVQDQAVVGPGPSLAQLAAVMAHRGEVLTVAVDRQRSRLVRDGLDGVVETEGPGDRVERQADTDVELGSFEHRHEEQARMHYRRVADAVAAEIARRPAGWIALAGPTEAVGAVQGYLPCRVAGLVTGQLSLGVSASRDELAREARALAEEVAAHRHAELVTELEVRAADQSGAVRTLEGTLAALADDQVETLLVEEGFAAPGGRCPRCGRLAPSSGPCPRCGATLVSVEDVVDLALTEAFVHHAALTVCPPGELAGVGRIGAIERR